MNCAVAIELLELCAQLSHPRVDARVRAALELGEHPEGHTELETLTNALDDGDPAVRDVVVDALDRIIAEHPEALTELVERANDEERPELLEMVAAAEGLPNERLKAMLDDGPRQDDNLHRTAAEILGLRGDAEGYQVLFREYRSQSTPSSRWRQAIRTRHCADTRTTRSTSSATQREDTRIVSGEGIREQRLTKLQSLVDEVAYRLQDLRTTMAAQPSITLKSLAQAPLVRTVVDATADIPEEQLRTPKVLAMLLDRLADELLPTSDPLAIARLRGRVAMREVLSQEGGALTASQVAEVLGISRQAVDKRRKGGQLLALTLPRRGLLYPAWQFGETGATLPGFVEVLEALGDHDEWAQARFFLNGSDRLGGKRPLDCLREGDLDPVLQAARAFGEHGAA
jgi:hypothetical protein